ncbi:MAG: multidrug effflux MFS transporter [Legionellaceae bacterium]|nr:multidrug effflux MFS transporter [Legionellaceae bacterium]
MGACSSFGITKKEFKLLSLTILLAICGAVGLDIHLASLPYIMRDLATDKQAMQQSISLYMLGSALSMLIYGPLSDKLGRKPVVIVGLILFCISSFATMTTKSVSVFLLLRLIQGIGSGVSWGLARIIAADVMQNERLAAIGSYFTLFLSLSPLLAPVLGGYIQHWFNWQANFIILGSIIFVVLVSFIVFFEETNLHLNEHAFKLKILLKNYASLFRHRLFVGALLLGGISLAVNIIYITLSSFIFQEQFKVSPIAFGWLTAIVGTASVLTKIISPFFMIKSKSHRIMRCGIILLWLSSFTLFIASLLDWMNIAIVLIAASIAMAALTLMGNISMSLALSPFHRQRGSAGALYGAFQLLFSFGVSAIAAGMSYSGTTVMTILYIVLACSAGLLYKIFLREKV